MIKLPAFSLIKRMFNFKLLPSCVSEVVKEIYMYIATNFIPIFLLMSLRFLNTNYTYEEIITFKFLDSGIYFSL